MRVPTHHANRERLDVKMTPMIDVIFLLLIFFVCTASFQRIEQVLPTNLSMPGMGGAPAEIEPPEMLDEVVIKIFWQDDRPFWRINTNDYFTRADVRAVLTAVAALEVEEPVPVILDVDGDVPMENVIDVYDMCRIVGLEKILFAAKDEG